MKKTILVLVSFVFLSVLYAQKTDRPFHFGVSLSPELTAQQVNKKVAESKFAPGVSLNGDFYLALLPRLQLKTGIGMNLTRIRQVDYTATFPCDTPMIGGTHLYNSYFDIAVTAVYLNIPINLRLNLTGGQNHLFFDLGVQNAFLLTASEKATLYGCGSSVGYELMDPSIFAPQDYMFSLNAGIGYQASAFSGKTAFIELVSDYALTPTFVDTAILNNGKMLNIGLMLGVVF